MRRFETRIPRVCITALLTAASVVACAQASQERVKETAPSRVGSAATPSLALVTEGFNDRVRADVEQLRIATDAYHDVRVAQAAGYPTALPNCIADSTMGGMGRHYFDRAAYDAKLDVSHPEILIYAPGANGLPDHLVGVEYVIPFTLRPATEIPPRLFGQELKRHQEFKYWYLHVWAWKKNSAGLFADWDPSITC